MSSVFAWIIILLFSLIVIMLFFWNEDPCGCLRIFESTRSCNNLMKYVETWEELSECTSETHYLDIDIERGSGWIHDKNSEFNYDTCYYLSTHSFYNESYQFTNEILDKCGFNVRVVPDDYPCKTEVLI